MQEFLKRNYQDVLNKRKAIQEELLHRPKYLESDTYFIPNISENSRKLTDNRSEGDIHKTLFEEAEHLKSRKELKILEKQKEAKNEEMKAVTFHPSVRPRKKGKLSKHIDIKQYLNPDKR
jgi:hypothetical protein